MKERVINVVARYETLLFFPFLFLCLFFAFFPLFIRQKAVWGVLGEKKGFLHRLARCRHQAHKFPSHVLVSLNRYEMANVLIIIVMINNGDELKRYWGLRYPIVSWCPVVRKLASTARHKKQGNSERMKKIEHRSQSPNCPHEGFGDDGRVMKALRQLRGSLAITASKLPPLAAMSS